MVLGAAFIGNLVTGITTLWWLRGLILLIAVGSAIVLRIRPSVSLSQLRLLELVVFGSVVVQLSVMLMTRLAEFASLNDATSVASVRQQFLMAWCILIFIYGTLMPNTWQRGAAIMVPAAILPYVLIALQRWFSPEVASLLDADKASSALPFPLIAALRATFANHVINAARREAFKARQFGQDRLMERPGAGGMGEVYKAEHVLLKRPCAIKPANIFASQRGGVYDVAKLLDFGLVKEGQEKPDAGSKYGSFSMPQTVVSPAAGHYTILEQLRLLLWLIPAPRHPRSPALGGTRNRAVAVMTN